MFDKYFKIFSKNLYECMTLFKIRTCIYVIDILRYYKYNLLFFIYLLPTIVLIKIRKLACNNTTGQHEI